MHLKQSKKKKKKKVKLQRRSNEHFSIAFISLCVLRLQGGAPSYGVKFLKKFIDRETEHRPGSQLMVGAESFRPCVISA